MGRETGIPTGIPGLWDVPACSRHTSLPTSFLWVLTCTTFYSLPSSLTNFFLSLVSEIAQLVLSYRLEVGGDSWTTQMFKISAPISTCYNSRWTQWQIVQFDSQVNLWLSFPLCLPLCMLFLDSGISPEDTREHAFYSTSTHKQEKHSGY